MSVIVRALALSLLLHAGALARQDDARLAELFAQLSSAESGEEAAAVELDIWKIWTDAGREDVNRLMAAGIRAMQYRHFEVALDAFDEVVELDPEFAEGWNKRATVHWLMDNNEQSMADIRRTLSLEPRHFGAISGMGLIFLEGGQNGNALEAFEQVLRIHPHSRGAKMRVEELRTLIQEQSI